MLSSLTGLLHHITNLLRVIPHVEINTGFQLQNFPPAISSAPPFGKAVVQIRIHSYQSSLAASYLLSHRTNFPEGTMAKPKCEYFRIIPSP